MKRNTLAFLSLVCLASNLGLAAEKYYGKITSIDHSQKNVTVHNTKQKSDANFKWDEKTGMTSNKKAIAPTELKVGQSLIVSYVTENDLNKAKKITVRTPFKKAAQ